jgi:hypothetical protein
MAQKPYIFRMPKTNNPTTSPYEAVFEAYTLGFKVEAQLTEDQRIAALPPGPPLSFADHLYPVEMTK